MLAMNRPIVPTNHRTNTGQRCRALQSATRTVHGTPTGRSGGAVPAELSGGVAESVMGSPGADELGVRRPGRRVAEARRSGPIGYTVVTVCVPRRLWRRRARTL